MFCLPTDVVHIIVMFYFIFLSVKFSHFVVKRSIKMNVIDQCIRAKAVVEFSVILTVTVWD